MTTIAWDGKMLAADRQVSSGNGQRGHYYKLFRGDHDGNACVFGGCGTLADIEEIADWLFRNAVRPILDEDCRWGILIGLGVKPQLIIGKRVRLSPITGPFMALGSGGDYAMGAMEAGKNAREAVEIACKFDVWSGGGVDVAEVGP